jgi:hypothetical protein
MGLGQDELLDIFKKNKSRWVSSVDIRGIGIELSAGSISKSLDGLYARGYLVRKRVNRTYFYWYDGKDYSMPETLYDIRK